MNLNHARMPIPPQLHIAIDFSKAIIIIANDFLKNKSFFQKNEISILPIRTAKIVQLHL